MKLAFVISCPAFLAMDSYTYPCPKTNFAFIMFIFSYFSLLFGGGGGRGGGCTQEVY